MDANRKAEFSAEAVTITSHLFEAYLKCSTKCFLRSLGEADTGNAYANWVQTQTEAYRSEGLKRLMKRIPRDERAVRSPGREYLTTKNWRLAGEFVARSQNLESSIHAIERIPSKGRGKPAQWNNNNAGHAIKAFALLRRDFSGVATEKGIRDYLILLSISETCKFKGVSFLDFLCSGEKDIDAFAESKSKREHHKYVSRTNAIAH